MYNSPMIPLKLENLFDSDGPSNDMQSHDGQLPRSTDKGEELVLTEPQKESPNSTMAPNTGILCKRI